MNSLAAPEVHVRGGLSGLLRVLSLLAPVSPGAVFAAAALCSSLSVAFLASALARHRKLGLSDWPPYTVPLWGLLLASDGTLAYLGASDAHHNVALLAFSLGAWWYGEAAAAPSRLALLGVFLGSAFTGLTRVELLAFPLAIPFLLPARQPSCRDRGQAEAAAALGLGMLLAWFLMSERNPLGQIALYHPRTLTGFASGLFTQSPFGGDLPPLLASPLLGAAFLVFLACAVRFGNRKHLALAAAYTALTVPKILGGYPNAGLGGFEDTQRYNIILIPLALLMAAAGAGWGVQLFLDRRLPLRGAGKRGVCAGLACAAAVWLMDSPLRWSAMGRTLEAVLLVLAAAHGLAWLLDRRPLSGSAKRRLGAAALACAGLWLAWTTVSMRRASRLLPHQAEFAFLSRNLERVPPGSTVVSVWLKMLGDKRDADTQLAVPHALLVHLRPDINWVAVMPGDPLPALRSFLYYKGASCSMDPAQGVVTGPDLAGDRELLRAVAVLCRRLEAMASTWEARQRTQVREATVHLVGERLDLGLAWIDRGND